MATTGFWPVKGSLNDVVKYAENPDKTTNPNFLDRALADSLKYVSNDEKTDKQLFITGINCPAVRAYEQMMATKKRYGKLGGNVAYHGYQSFRSGEVTPEEAHRIGIETAKRMWGDEYEIVVTTHLNTDNLHNHIVLNSVSFKTGRKFENHVSDHIKLREISDKVCKEYSKSVLEEAPFYKSSKKEYWVHKNGGMTHRDILRKDVDEAISQSKDLVQFRNILVGMGYEFVREISKVHPSVKARGWKRAVRIDSLGDDYTTPAISRRIKEAMQLARSFGGSYSYRRKPHTPLMEMEYQLRRVKYMDTLEAAFYLITELLKPMKDKPQNYRPPLSPLMRHELVRFERYKKQMKLMNENDIHTDTDLDAYIEKTRNDLNGLTDKRNKADNLRRRAVTQQDKDSYSEQRKRLTAEIAPLREKLRLAEGIKDSMPDINNAIEEEYRLETKAIRKARNR